MFGLKEVEAIEGEAESAEEYFSALQSAINSLKAWKFQGSFGRAMMDALEAGKCMLGHHATTDYWGNRIPSRTEVQDGTKGSRSFVVKHSGEEWAVMLETVS
jgi:hypothetical protein